MKKKTLEDAFGSWKGRVKGSSKGYVRKLRKEWKARSKKLKIPY